MDAQNQRDVELQQLEPQPVLSIRGTVLIAELEQAQDDRFRALSEYLQQRGVQAAGPPFVRYHTFGDGETDLETGVPLPQPIQGEGRIAAGALPGGPAISTWHYGAHDTLGDAYARIAAWIQAHGREADGANWEIYYWIDADRYTSTSDWPDPATWRAQLVQPLKHT